MISYFPLDQRIWHDIRNGDAQAFNKLFFDYSDPLLSYGLTITGDRELIKDCLQELFLDIWNRKAQLPEVKVVKYYLIKSFRRILFRKLKQNSRKSSLNPEDSQFPDPGHTLAHDELIIADESDIFKNKVLINCVNALPSRQKEIIYLKYFQGFSYEEISEIMGIGSQASWNLLSRAIKKLRTAFNAQSTRRTA